MSARKLAIAVLVVLALTGAGALTSALPVVTFVDPVNNDLLDDHAINVTGNASGSNGKFFHANRTEFERGTMDHASVNATERVVLDRRVTDNFDDNSLNTSKWTKTEVGGLSILEENKLLNMFGNCSNPGANWTEYVRLVSVNSVSKMVSANLKAFSGWGAGFRSFIMMVDSSTGDYVRIGRTNDGTVYGKAVIELASMIGGVNRTENLGNAPLGARSYMIAYSSGKAHIYQAQTELKSVDIILGSCKFHIVAGTKNEHDNVSANWDDAVSDYYDLGLLTSYPLDTRSIYPILRFVDWNATTSPLAAVTMQLRSSDSPTMGSATPWTQVTKGQTANLPAVKRYLQYKATLITTNGVETPGIVNVTIIFNKPVTKVELSIDGKANWVPAVGKDPWYQDLVLPENDTTIWVRVTDVAGDTNLTSIKVSVDTTPPEGGVVINDGAFSTGASTVTLKFNATDRYGIAKVMVNSSRDFTGCAWQDYAPTLAWTMQPGDGDKTTFVKFRDRAGWESAVANDSIYLDTVPPVGSVVIDGNATYTSTLEVDLTIEATDPSGLGNMMVGLVPTFEGATVVPYQEHVAFTLGPGDGEKRVYVAFWDSLGHLSGPASDSILLDTKPPVGTFKINDGAKYANSTRVELSMSALDTSGVAAMRASEDPALLDADWVPYAPTMPFTMTPGDGEKRVYASFLDILGLESAVAEASIILKTTLPVVTVTINDGEGYTRVTSITVQFEVTQNGPATRMQVGEDPTLARASIASFKPEVSLILSPGEGERHIYARVFDVAGNAGPIASATIVLDDTAPTVTVTINGGALYTNSTHVMLGIAITDNFLVTTLEVSEDQGFVNSRTEPASAVPIAFTVTGADGKKTVYVRAMDAAGNLGPVAKGSITVDTVPPVLTLKLDGTATSTRSRDVKLSLDARDGGQVQEMLLWEGASPQGASAAAFKDTVTFTVSASDGEKTISARVKDAAGNWGAASSVKVVLDMTAPTTVVTAVAPKAGKLDVALTWSSTDAQSGASHYQVQYRESSGEWLILVENTTAKSYTFTADAGRTYSFRVRAVDSAGNVEPYTEDASRIATASVPKKGSGLPPLVNAAIVVAALVAVGGALRRRGGRA